MLFFLPSFLKIPLILCTLRLSQSRCSYCNNAPDDATSIQASTINPNDRHASRARAKLRAYEHRKVFERCGEYESKLNAW